MLHAAVRRLPRRTLRPEADVAPHDDDWADSTANCHDSSYDLATGLDVIEHFADALPAFLAFQAAPQGWR